MDWQGYFDGASRGNPGPSGAGAALVCDGRIVWRAARPLGQCTNNEAEYAALGLLMGEIERRGLTGGTVCGDSQLVVRQITGQWKIKEPRLAALAGPLIERARRLKLAFRWVPREQNAEADGLSNHALDSGELDERLDGGVAASPNQAGPHFRPVEPGVWLVDDEGQTYAVDLTHGRCSCDEFARRGRCRHIDGLRDRLGR